jgi:hypothetical protein
MARDFESFIVDPSLLDPSIDTSNLRTTTDTREELLSDVPDYAGIQFDPTRTSYLDDLYALYSGQLPMTPTATTPAVGSPANGGGGDGTPATITPSTPITTDLTDDQINEFAMPNNIGGITGDSIEMENLSPIDIGTVDDYDDLDDYNRALDAANVSGTIDGAPSVFDINKVGDPSQNQGSTNVGDQPMAAGPFDYLQPISTIANPEIFDSYGASVNDPQIGDTGFENYTPSTSTAPQTETESALSQAFRLGKKALDSGMQTISQVGQSIADSVKGTYDDLNKKVDVPGLGEISVRDTLAGLAVNTLVGAPVSFVKYVMDKMPPSASQLAYEGYTSEQQAAVDKEFGPGGLLDGYNAVSAFGKDAKDIAEDVLDQRLDNVGIDQRTLDLAKLVETLGGDVSAIESTLSGDINPEGTGDASVAEAIAAADRAAAKEAAEAAEIDRQQREKDAADAAAAQAAAQAAAAKAAAEAAEIDRQQREKDAADAAAAAQAARDAIRERDLGTGPQFEGGRDSSGTGGGWGNSATGGGWCFDPSTPIQMADGSTKEIKNIQLGDDTKGGEVTGVFQFKAADEIHDYKGVTVAGSHFVKEDGKFIMVKDSPLAVKIDKIPVVYSLDTSGRRIFINDIEFADYNGDGIAKGFLHNAGLELNGFNKEVLRQVENRLI